MPFVNVLSPDLSTEVLLTKVKARRRRGEGGSPLSWPLTPIPGLVILPPDKSIQHARSIERAFSLHIYVYNVFDSRWSGKAPG
jgi:hypothetical protein